MILFPTHPHVSGLKESWGLDEGNPRPFPTLQPAPVDVCPCAQQNTAGFSGPPDYVLPATAEPGDQKGEFRKVPPSSEM